MSDDGGSTKPRHLTAATIFYNSTDMEKSSAIEALAALAQETRLDVFRLLVQAGVEGLPAGRIGEALGLPGATLSST